ncbi:prepilin peptidase [Alkalihalobacillus trypoxylicola]|uniref:Prepilin leader peptidase/N-methyltransferase n=1 Tax=Alkalihalobacillus trypoxylicola TaxID=519424 RepID=A0A161PHG7_9BACI|nr:A24 family peptidase [Alkalihalobacillus trypoxylicola]KYG32304.1 prepilin peptidase [Alkalihalobacillus trypoxylicola]
MVEWILYSYIALVGLCLGSFYNVVGLRLPIGTLWDKARSYTPCCQRKLSTKELIPLFSYLFLHGKCLTCKTRISPIYPSIEFLTALLFIFAFWKIGFQVQLIEAFLLISLSLILIVSDMRYMLIPNKLLLFFTALFIGWKLLFVPLDMWGDFILGAMIGFIVLLVVAIVSKGGMGGGDIKLFALLGFVLGYKLVILTFMLSCFLGALIGGCLMLMGVVKRKQPIPFAPFIVVAALVSYFYGNQMIDWYFAISNL